MAALKPLVRWLGVLAWACALVAHAQSPVPPAAAAHDPQIAAPAGPPRPGVPRGRVTEMLTGLAGVAGMRVREVRLTGASIDQDTRLRQNIVQQAGQPLDRAKVRRSIQNLYATGRFANIRVDAQRTAQGEIDLVFVAEENFFIGRKTVTGMPPHGPTDNQLLNASKLDLGTVFTQQKLDEAIAAMKSVLREHGFYRAQVAATVRRHPDTQQVDIAFTVEGGERARIGQVSYEGDTGFTPFQLEDITKLHPGDKVTNGKAQRAMQRLLKKYNKRDRLEAEVALVSAPYDEASNTVSYNFRVDRGPTVDIHVEGASLSNRKLKRYVPVYEENAVDGDLLNEGRRNIRDYFQTQGFFDVKVEVEQEQDQPGHRHIIYQIERGERHQLAAVRLEGNRYFPADLIRERLLIQAAGWLLWHGRFSQSMLSRDIESIVNLYRANGFQQVNVTGDVQDDVGEEGRMVVTFRIEEGPQTLVRNLQITGNASVSESELRGLLTTTEGQPFSEFNLATDRDSIVNYYFNRGFPDVRFEAAPVAVPGQPDRMDVTYKLVEGERVYIDRVVVTGLHFTRPYVVERELQVRDGQPLSQETMFDTQRRLYDLGIFNQVDVAVQNPDGAAREKNILINVQEARRWTFNYGIGVEIATGADVGADDPQGRTGVSPRVSFDATRINFLGRNHTLIFKSRVGRLQKRALFSYEAPRWFNNEDLRLTFTAFYDDTRDVRTFTAERLEGSAQIEHRLSRPTTLLYRFTYRRVKVDPRTLVIDPGLIPLFSRPVRIGMPSFTWIRDLRDDPLESHRGSFTTVDTGVAAGFLSEATFARLLFQNNTYHPFKRQRWVLARSTRIGLERPFGGSGFVPLPERFFAGGGNSHRGFAINQAGPRDRETGFPVGGEAMFLNNIELRTPPIQLPFLEENVSAVVFHDMGNVFASTSDLFPSLFRVAQPSKRNCELLTITATCDLNYLSHAIGAGIRYRTPIGPVRVDFGYNLNPPTFPIRREGRSDTLGRFNFFFSIGQTF